MAPVGTVLVGGFIPAVFRSGVVMGGTVLIGDASSPIGAAAIVPAGIVLIGGYIPSVFRSGIVLGGTVLIGGICTPARFRPSSPSGTILIGGSITPSFTPTSYSIFGTILIGGFITPSHPGPPPAHAWYDTFSSATSQALTAHVGQITPGGYTLASGDPGEITGGTDGWYLGGAGTSDRVNFDPGLHLATAVMTFTWTALSGNLVFNWNGGAGSVDLTDTELFVNGIALAAWTLAPGTYTVTITDTGTTVFVVVNSHSVSTPSNPPVSTLCWFQVDGFSIVDASWLVTSITIN